MSELSISPSLDINKRDRFGNTPLMQKIQRGNIKDALVLLGQGADVNLQNRKGETALMVATWCSYTKMVQYLMNKGAKINHQNNDGNTALMMAVWVDDIELIQVLVDNGADPTHENKHGNTALKDAAQRKNFDLILLFKNLGFDISSVREFIEKPAAEKKEDIQEAELRLQALKAEFNESALGELDKGFEQEPQKLILLTPWPPPIFK